MSLLSTEEYQRKGHQVDLDVSNLDSKIQGVRKFDAMAIPTTDAMQWDALKAEWQHFFQKNIRDTPLLPFQSDDELSTWIGRLEPWRTRITTLASAASDPRAKALATIGIPVSPATIEHRENPPKGVPTWAYMLLGIGALGALGYALPSVAKLGGR